MKACIGLASLVGATWLFAASGGQACTARQSVFGHLSDGTTVEMVTLTNDHGMSARVVAWGAMLQSLVVPDRWGLSADVILAYPDMDGYLNRPQFFGATVGRFANRIAGAAFTLDGKHYSLTRNAGPNSLHGGPHDLANQVWTIASVKSGPTAEVALTLTSPDGEEGFPGELRTRVTYSLDDAGNLTLTYEATTDKSTVINLTNHSYFNLAGANSGHSALDQQLTIAADDYTPADDTLIPTGELRPVAGTPFDFRTSHVIGERVRDAADPQIVNAHGYDHNFVLRGGVTARPHFAARLVDPGSGRVLELWTTEPGLQLYSGNGLNGSSIGVGKVAYRQGDGVALEAEHFPNSPNQPSFPSVRLDPGQTYHQITVFKLSVSKN